MILSPQIIFRWTDDNGNPAVGWQVETYIAGSSTPVTTYTDSTGASQNTNPIILNARGEADIWLDPSIAYKFVVKNPLGAIQKTVDQITSGGGSGGLSRDYNNYSASVGFSGLGTLASPLSASVKLSTYANNALQIRGDGLYAMAIGGGGSVAWGLITGNINAQTDLINKFDEYLPKTFASPQLLTFTGESEFRFTGNGEFSAKDLDTGGTFSLIPQTRFLRWDDGSYVGNISFPALASNLTWTLPNASGTLALTSQIPSLSGYATESWVTAGFQPLDADLTALAALSGTSGLIRRTGSSFVYDNAAYITASALADYIKKDGTTPTTASIPFAFGATFNAGVTGTSSFWNDGIIAIKTSADAGTPANFIRSALKNRPSLLIGSTQTITAGDFECLRWSGAGIKWGDLLWMAADNGGEFRFVKSDNVVNTTDYARVVIGALSATTGDFSSNVTASTAPSLGAHLTNKTYVDGNFVSLSGSYANPSWISSLAWSKITGAPSIPVGSDYIAKNGTTTATATIPFVQGISLANDQTIAWNAGSLIRGTSAGNIQITPNAGTNGALFIDAYNINYNAANRHLWDSGILGSTAKYQFNGSAHINSTLRIGSIPAGTQVGLVGYDSNGNLIQGSVNGFMTLSGHNDLNTPWSFGDGASFGASSAGLKVDPVGAYGLYLKGNILVEQAASQALSLYRPTASGDVCLNFDAWDSLGAQSSYAQVCGVIVSSTAGAVGGGLDLEVAIAGVLTPLLQLRQAGSTLVGPLSVTGALTGKGATFTGSSGVLTNYLHLNNSDPSSTLQEMQIYTRGNASGVYYGWNTKGNGAGGTTELYLRWAGADVLGFVGADARFNGALTAKPPASITPANNGDMTFELTSNTQLTIKVRGSDGVVRSNTLTLT